MGKFLVLTKQLYSLISRKVAICSGKCETLNSKSLHTKIDDVNFAMQMAHYENVLLSLRIISLYEVWFVWMMKGWSVVEFYLFVFAISYHFPAVFLNL